MGVLRLRALGRSQSRRTPSSGRRGVPLSGVRAWRTVSIIASVVSVVGCAGRSAAPPPSEAPAPEKTAAVSEPAPAEPGEPCPPADYAAIEPDKLDPDARTIALTRVFAPAAEPPMVAKGPAPRVELGELRPPGQGPPDKGGMGVGMGWQGLTASWVDGTLRPSVAGPFAAWIAARERLFDHQRGAYLLGTRVRYARSVPPPASWGSQRCLEAAATAAERAKAEAEAKVEVRAEALRAALEAADQRSGGEKLLLAVLVADAMSSPESEGDVARSLALLREVIDDEAAGRELRARAAEHSARISPMSAEVIKAHLERVLQLTRDPVLTIETMIKLTAISDDAAEQEAMRVTIIDRIDHLEGDDHHLGWRLAHTLADLAEDRLERGAYDLAVTDAARCARASAADFPRDPDPWDCAPTLAEAMAILAAAPESVEVPLAFLGPLAVASMRSALSRYDRGQARTVGELLLRELPEAAQAPLVLSLLDAVASTEAERDAIAGRLERDYGLESAWAIAQRERLAWRHGPDDIDAELARLRAPSVPALPRPPRTPSEREEELRQRARGVTSACGALLTGPKRKVGVAVDTRGAIPKPTIRGADRPLGACLRREVGAWFRSADPARISFTIVAGELAKGGARSERLGLGEVAPHGREGSSAKLAHLLRASLGLNRRP